MVFGAPDLPHNKRQHLLGKYTIAVSMTYARDFPVNIKPTRNVVTDNLMMKGISGKTNQRDSRTDPQGGAGGDAVAV